MNIPDKVIKRLTLYHCIFTDYLEKGIGYISSPQIAMLLNIDDSQVRKDLKYLNNTGKCRVGFEVKTLKNAIEKRLGFSDRKRVFIVGAGNLGLALTKYDDFVSYGINIVALFDNDPLKTGKNIGNKTIFDIEKLPELTKKYSVEMVILTVPREAAQSVANLLIKAGIKYIWNFTPCVLTVPDDVKVWNENIMGSCMQFIAHSTAD